MTEIELFKKLLQFKSITPNDDGAFEFITNYLGNEWECIELDFEDVKNKVSKITPVPGGVGPMTVAMLLSNTLKAFKQQNNINVDFVID